VWWPTAATASLTLAACGALAYQQQQISKLRQGSGSDRTHPGNPDAGGGTHPGSNLPRGLQEFRREPRIAEANRGQADSRSGAARSAGRGKRTAPTGARHSPGLSDAELADLKALQEQAFSTACINNLKQLGLAARIWSLDNQDVLPPDILSMTNEMNSPKILVCPADTRRQAASNWGAYSPANCSYEHLAPSGFVGNLSGVKTTNES